MARTRGPTCGFASGSSSVSRATRTGSCCSPASTSNEQLRDLVGIDIAAAPRRFTVIPEGIDVQRIDAADAALAMAADRSGDAPSPRRAMSVRRREP